MQERMQKVWQLVSDLNADQFRLYDTGDYKIYLNVSESIRMLMRAVGEHEPNKSELIRKHIRKGDVFLDAGASFGGTTLLAASLVGPAGRVYSFEANPENADWLKRSVSENHCENVEVSVSALGNENGTARLNLGQKSDQHSTAFKSAKFVDVPVTTIDSFVDERKLDKMSMMSIDVEGAEWNVLDGAKDSIERFTPYLILSYQPRKSPNARMIARQLGAFGYKIADVRAPETALDALPPHASNLFAWPARAASR